MGVTDKKYQFIMLTISAIIIVGGSFKMIYNYSIYFLGNRVLDNISNEKIDGIIKSKFDNYQVSSNANDGERKYIKYYNTNTTKEEVKYDLYSMIIPEDQENDDENYHNLNSTLPAITMKLCTYDIFKALESYEGNKVECPVGHVINIDNVFFGRRVGDKESCTKDEDGNDYPEEFLIVTEDKKCESNPIDKVKALCQNKRSCYIKPSTKVYGMPCIYHSLYMDVTYHCSSKDKEDPKFGIVMFADNVKKDSIYEHAISQFAQYADIHNYGFLLEENNIMKTRSIFYMKFYSILENLMSALRNKTYGWLFWVDGDVVLTNPNIKLEAFIPPEHKDDIHLVISDDINGLNAGVFLIRVHPWSVDFLIKAYSYAFYNLKTDLIYYDQSSMLHVLQEMENNDSHYVIVPQNWFNSYCCIDVKVEGSIKKGDFLMHLAGILKKDEISKSCRETVFKDKEYYSKTNSQMRKEVLEYYKLPKDQQHELKGY